MLDAEINRQWECIDYQSHEKHRRNENDWLWKSIFFLLWGTLLLFLHLYFRRMHICVGIIFNKKYDEMKYESFIPVKCQLLLNSRYMLINIEDVLWYSRATQRIPFKYIQSHGLGPMNLKTRQVTESTKTCPFLCKLWLPLLVGQQHACLCLSL